MTTYARRQNLRRFEEYYDEVPLSELEVVADCKVCFKARERIVPEEQIMLLSPNGIVHHSSGYGITDCGKDGTGDGWWWRL